MMMTISLGRLTVRDGWPQTLRGKDFAPERAAYHRALDTALEQNLEGKLMPETFKALKKSVEGLRFKMMATIPASETKDYVQARAFIDDIDEAVAPLHDPTGEKVLAGVDRYAGTTTGDAVTFMRRFNLRFAPALTGDERESYQLLYVSMLRLRATIDPNGKMAGGDQVDPKAIVPAEDKQ
jgi:hypothetical protein